MKHIQKIQKPLTSEDFEGSYPGKTDAIKIFHCDVLSTWTTSASANGGYHLTIHSVKRQLYSLQWPGGMLIGIGDPVSNPDYMSYLVNFPLDAIAMLKKTFESCGFDSKNPLLFAVDNTIRLLPGNPGLFYLCLPDNSYEITTELYDNPAFSKEILKEHENQMGAKIGVWLKKRFNFIEKVEKRRKLFLANRKIYSDE
jgi:hypothetical protein